MLLHALYKRLCTAPLNRLPYYGALEVIMTLLLLQEAQLMLTTGSTRLAVSRGQQTWYHSTCYIWFPIVQ